MSKTADAGQDSIHVYPSHISTSQLPFEVQDVLLGQLPRCLRLRALQADRKAIRKWTKLDGEKIRTHLEYSKDATTLCASKAQSILTPTPAAIAD